MNIASALSEFGSHYVFMRETPQSFGERYVNSKYARPYRHKNRKALSNFRSGNRKKLHQYA